MLNCTLKNGETRRVALDFGKVGAKFRATRYDNRLILAGDGAKLDGQTDNSFFSVHLDTGDVYAVANVQRDSDGRIYRNGGMALRTRGKKISASWSKALHDKLVQRGVIN